MGIDFNTLDGVQNNNSVDRYKRREQAVLRISNPKSTRQLTTANANFLKQCGFRLQEKNK